ncbi:MAG: maleylpyruvate isomerase N-terminal domain-containing protein, partial [Caldilineaceae bacterium]|nr:maleylpyruvate isomerase N-terminal domain-containing protein [Caldilineaceae bacterium]
MQTQFTALNDEIIAFVERCPDTLWRASCANDGRTVAVVAHHIASSHEPVLQLAQMVANAQPLPPLSHELFDAANAEHAQQAAHCTQAEVSALLREKGQTVVTALHQLTAEQLARTAHIAFVNATMRAQDVIEQILIGHARLHFANMQAT